MPIKRRTQEMVAQILNSFLVRFNSGAKATLTGKSSRLVLDFVTHVAKAENPNVFVLRRIARTEWIAESTMNEFRSLFTLLEMESR